MAKVVEKWRRGLLVALCLTAVSTAAVAEIYRWVDADGKVHYSDSPPPGDKAQQVELPPQPSEASLQQSRADIARRIQNQQDDSAARQEAQQQKQQAREKAARSEAERQVRCAFAQNQLQVLNTQAPVFRENESGEREFADDAFREAEKARFQGEVAEFCD